MKYYFLLIVICFSISSAEWQEMNKGFEGGAVYNVNEYEGDYYFATHGGIYYTQDNFESYDRISINGSLTRITAFLIHNDIFYAGTRDSLLKSTDYGESWHLSSEQLPYNWVQDIKSDGNNIFVVLGGKGVFYSDDGTNWYPKNNGLEKAYPGEIIIDGNTLFLIDDFEVFISNDYGDTWIETVESPEFVNALIKVEDRILAGNADGIYEYVFDTNSWVLIQDNSEMKYITELYYNKGVIYAGTNSDGIFFSNDYGVTWSKLGTAEMNYNIIEIIISDEQIIAFTSSGIYITTDNGNSWQSKNNNLHNTIVRSILFKDDDIYSSGDKRIFKYNLTENEWIKTNEGYDSISVFKLFTHNNDIYAICTNSILKSTDDGYSWEYKSEGLPIDNVFIDIFTIDNELYVASYDGLYVSTDNSDSWSLKSQEAPARSFTVYEDKGVIYSGAWSGFFASYDKGESWVQLYESNSMITAIFVQDDFIIASAFRDVLISFDGGESWEQIEGVFGNTVFKFIKHNEYLFVATSDGLLISENNGRNWEFPGNSLFNLSVYDVVINDEYLYVCTDGGGIYKAPVSDFITSSVSESDLTDFFIYPNPASDYIEITITKTSEGSDIVIYDLLGNVQINYEFQNTNYDSPHKIDISHLPRGVYFVRFGDKVEKFLKK